MDVTQISKLLVLRNFSGSEVWTDLESLCPGLTVHVKHCGEYFQPTYEFLQEAEPDMVCLDLIARKPITGNDSHNSTLPDAVIGNFIKAFERFQPERSTVKVLAWPSISETRPDTTNLSFDKEIPSYKGAREIVEALRFSKRQEGER